jgi:hypothetical protein
MHTTSLAAAAASILLLAFAAPAAAANSAPFTDSCADADFTVPDICTVDVSNDDRGTLEFVVNVSNQAGIGPLVPNSHITIALDTDRDSHTGCGPHGAEAALNAQGRLTSPAFSVGLCKGGELVYSPAGGCQHCPRDQDVTFTVDRCDIGSPSGFDFALDSGWRSPEGEGPPDFAPDVGTWHYDLIAPSAACTKPLALSARSLTLTPSRPRGGARATATLLVATTDVAAALSGRVSCSVMAGRTKLAVTPSLARAAGGEVRARCAFRVPAGARNRLLTGRVGLIAGGKSVARTFSTRTR